MPNLIGLVLGNALAAQASVPRAERGRFALLGAASPSPVLGLILVRAALAQREDDNDDNDDNDDEGGGGAGVFGQRRRRAPTAPRDEVLDRFDSAWTDLRMAVGSTADVQPSWDEFQRAIVALSAHPAIRHREQEPPLEPPEPPARPKPARRRRTADTGEEA